LFCGFRADRSVANPVKTRPDSHESAKPCKLWLTKKSLGELCPVADEIKSIGGAYPTAALRRTLIKDMETAKALADAREEAREQPNEDKAPSNTQTVRGGKVDIVA